MGLICQPDFRDEKSITVLGTPRLGFLVSAGNMDSMVNHYTVALKKRKTDAYSPGGEMGRRPDYATIVYCNLIRKVYKHEPIIVGGIEASLRRLGHYDYWSNKVRRSILLDSGADIISYGMGEVSIVEIADALASGLDVADITFINGTVFKTRNEENIFMWYRIRHQGLLPSRSLMTFMRESILEPGILLMMRQEVFLLSTRSSIPSPPTEAALVSVISAP